ncbi:RE1-silencing transcription factor [Lethenteron reissneri]|uniref:RE1-silencing transcription factor n=1 Tax=Lethenteron reissneri TaxID=7753 RepID=UPI002AB7E819|nr:RE1-silencing transcription factor [Lethenteron reissneri]
MASGAVSMACYAGEVPAASSTECGTSEGPLMAELKTVAELALMSDVDMSYDDDDDDNDDGGSGGVRGRGLMKPLSDDDDDDNGMSLRLPDRFAQELSKLEAAAVAAAAASAASAEAAAAAAAAAEAAAAGPVPAAMKLEEGARSAVGYFRKITATPVPSRPPMLVQEPLTAVEPCVPRAGEEQALTGESGLPVGGAAVAAAVVVTAVEKEEDEAVVGSGGEARSRGSRRPKSFFCRPCQFTTTSEAEFRHHISSHGAKKYLLEQQGETNVRTQAHTAAGGPIRCEKCGYNTNRYDHYLAHLKHHERVAGAALPPSPVVPPLRQPNEPRPSENRENRSAVAAPVLAPASAPVVEGGATVQSSERVFRCVLCLYSTVSEYHWKKHLRNHFPRKVYTCGSCCYYSDRKNNYLQHLRTHTGERPYQCPHCSYSSSQKTHLTRHMRIHSGEKPFHCDRCTYVASNQHEVTRHLRQVHSDGPKPLVCGECGYRTADRSNYKKHVLLHTSPRRFPCPACSYAASKKCNLTYHLHSKHPTYTGTATTAATMAATTTTVVTAARQQQPPPPMVSPAPPALSSSATSVKVEGASSKRSVVCGKSDTGSGGGCCTAKVNGVKREGRGRKRQGGAVAAAVAARGRAGGPPGVMGPAKETPEKKVKCEEKATAVGREASQPALPSPSSPRPPPAMMEEAGAELECEEVTSSIVKAAKRRGRRPSLKMAALAMEAEAPVGRSRRRGRKRKSKEEEQKGDDEGVKKLRNESEHVKGVVGKNAKKLKATVRKKAESVVMENRGGGYSRKKQQRNSEKIEAVPPTRKRKTTSGGDDTNEVNGREGATTAACPPSRRRGRRSKANVVVMLAADEEGEAASCERASEPPLPPSSTSPPLTQEAILAAGVIKQEVTPPVLPIPLKNQEVNDSTGAVTLLVKQAEEVTFLTNPTQEVTSLVQCTQEATSPVKQVPEVELPVPKSQPEVPHPPALSPLRHQPPYFSLKPEATTSVASGKQTRAAQRRRLSDKPQAFSGKRSQSPPALCMHDEEGSLQSTLKPADAVTSSRPRRVPAKRAPKRKINGGRKSVAKSWARNCGPVESPDSKPQPASCEGAVAATAAVVVVTARAEEMPAAGSPPAPSPPISGARSHLATCAGPSGAAGVGFLCRFAPEPNSGRTGWNQPGSDEDRGGPRMSDAFARALQLQRVDHRQQLQQQQQHLHRLYHLRSYLVRRERSYVHSSGAFDGASWLKVGTELCGARQCREAVAAVATAPPSTPSDDGMESPLSLDSDGPFTRHDYSTAHQQQEGRPRTSGDEGRGEMDEDEGIHSHDGRSSPERCFDDDEKERTGEEEEARARRKSERRRCRRRRQAFEQKPDLGGVCNVTPIISQLTTEVVPIPPPPPPAALPLPPEPLQKGPMLPLPWLRPSPGRSPVTPRGPVPPPPLQTRGMCVFCDRHCHGDADYTFRLRRNLVNVYYLERETAGQNVSNGDVEGDGGHCAGHHVGQGMKRAGEGDGEREGEKIAKNDGETGGKEDGERDEGNNGGRDRKKIREKDREKITDDAGGKDTELERVTGDANGKEDVVSQQCGHQKRTKEQSTQTVLSREDDTQTDVPREQDAKADAPREWCAQQDDASPKDRDVRSDSSREPDAHADAYRDQDTQTYILREQYTQTDACRAPGTQARGAREQETQTDLAVETS